MLLDCLLDTSSLLFPAVIMNAHPCAASLTMATLFRSLAMPLVALLSGNFARMPEALLQCTALTIVATLRAQQCINETDSTTLIVLILFGATLATAILSVRQAVEQTWPATNVARIPVFAALLWHSGGIPDVQTPPIVNFTCYAIMSVLASRAVMAYNASVNEDAYFKTRMLSTRRLISAVLGLTVLEHYTPVAICLATGLLALTFVSDVK